MRIPGNAYGLFANIFNFPGSEGLRGIQEEVVPTQDLSRLLQFSRAKSVVYSLTTTPGASLDRTAQWDDASDWTECQVNGIVTTVDADCPQPTDVRILTGAYLNVTGTLASYTSAELSRINISTGVLLPFAAFGAITTGHNGPAMIAPYRLPQYLLQGVGIERTIDIRMQVSGAGATYNWTFTMLSAESGVFAPYPGV